MSVLMAVDEAARLNTLHCYGILDTPAEQAFDDLAALAASICETPIAFVTLVDASRQWFKAKVGLIVSETPREYAFCAHTILQPDELFIVPDASTDERFAANPLVAEEPKIRFYAGTALTTVEGHALGTLCVIDRVSRQLTAEQVNALRILARQVMTHLELRRKTVEFARVDTERVLQEEALQESEARFRSLAAASPTGIFFDDAEGLFTYTNPRWQEITGLTLDESLEEGWTTAIHPEDKSVTMAEWFTHARIGKEFSQEFRFVRPNGEVRWVQARTVPIYDRDGRLQDHVGTTEDITEKNE